MIHYPRRSHCIPELAIISLFYCTVCISFCITLCNIITLVIKLFTFAKCKVNLYIRAFKVYRQGYERKSRLLYLSNQFSDLCLVKKKLFFAKWVSVKYIPLFIGTYIHTKKKNLSVFYGSVRVGNINLSLSYRLYLCTKKLYSTYLSYLPREKVAFPLKMNCDARGSFTELLKTENCGQFSVNISKPGITKGQHWHHTKWEFFMVVAGRALIQQRRIGSDEVLNFEVSGEKIEAVHMLPGYTHNIINLSDTEDLVTLMWANEQFDPGRPDTFFEVVE